MPPAARAHLAVVGWGVMGWGGEEETGREGGRSTSAADGGYVSGFPLDMPDPRARRSSTDKSAPANDILFSTHPSCGATYGSPKHSPVSKGDNKRVVFELHCFPCQHHVVPHRHTFISK